MSKTEYTSEKVWLTNNQVKRIAEAMKNGEPLQLKLSKNKLLGNHPVYLDKNNIHKLKSARILGKGVTLNLNGGCLNCMAGAGLYMFGQTGQGMYMFGSNETSNNKTQAPTQLIRGSNVVFDTVQNKQPTKATFGNGLYNFGTGMHMFGSGYGPNYNTISVPRNFI
jgi:hypothetical protein